jgi:hypothetical protein
MREAYDKREHSAKPDTADLTDYQKLNSLGGAGMLVNPNEVPPLNVAEEDEQSLPITPTTLAGDTDSVTVYDSDYNDGVDFGIVDDEGKTNT